MKIPWHLSDDQIIDLARGDNDGDAMAHIAACARCRGEYEEYLETLDPAREVPPMPEGLFEEAWARAVPHFEPRRKPWWRRTTVLLIVAGVTVALIAAVLIWRALQ